MVARIVKIPPAHDEFRAERRHGRILFGTIAFGHDNRRLDPGGPGGEANRLPVIAARGGDNARAVASEPVHKNDAAANFESADWRMVLVLDPHLAAAACAQ